MDVVEAVRETVSRSSKLRLAIVFGSLSKDASRSGSDVDLAVLGSRSLSSPEKADIIAAVGEATGRPVDLVDLATVGEPLLGEILRGGRRILERDPEAWPELLRRHVFDATDFLPYRRRILEERRRVWLGR